MIVARQPLLGFAFSDASGSIATCRFNLKAGITVADGHTAGDGLRSVLAALSSAVVVRQSIVYPYSVQQDTIPQPGSRIENRAALIFETSAAGQLLSVSIPSILPALIQAAGPLVGLELDTTNQAVIDLVQEIINGLWCNPFGYDVVSLASTIVETVD